VYREKIHQKEKTKPDIFITPVIWALARSRYVPARRHRATGRARHQGAPELPPLRGHHQLVATALLAGRARVGTPVVPLAFGHPRRHRVRGRRAAVVASEEGHHGLM